MWEWIIIGVAVFGVAAIADRLLPKRGHTPLSKTRPNVIEPARKLGQEATDLTRMDAVNAENRRLNAMNGANRRGNSNLNEIVPRLKTKPRQKDGPPK